MSRVDRAYHDPDPEQTDPAPGNTSGSEDTSTRSKDWLTDDNDSQVAREMIELWENQSKLHEVVEREAKWKVNEARRSGYSGVRLVREGNGKARAWIPVGGSSDLELSNEARRLCRAFVGNLLADPPAPQVFPADTGPGDRDTSDVSERALVDLQSERRLNTPIKVRDALDNACTYGSGYISYIVDPTGGGRTARRMMASPLAASPEAPLLDPGTGQPWTEMEPVPPPLDPMTGQPMMLPQMDGAPPPMQPKVDPMTGQPLPPPEPVERIVGKDEKSFTENAPDAAYDWVKEIKSEVLTGRNVRPIPHTAENIWEATGVMIATYQSWKSLKTMFERELGSLSEEQVDALIAFRPQGTDDLLPKNRRGQRETRSDNALVFTLVVCFKECGDYPDGYYGIAVGDKHLCHRQPWISYSSGTREGLHLPVSQVKLFRNGRSDPAGDGLMDDLGGISEVMAAQIGHLLAYLDWFNNPTYYVPLNSTVQDSDILSRKRIVRIIPGGEPKVLDPPRYPGESMTIFELMRDGASKASHLMETAQGVEDPSVKSGRHAYQIVAQAHAQLSEPKQNIERGYIRCCDIELQYARAFDLEGDARWTGDDGSFKIKRWKSADLGGDVHLKPGTMTMLSPAAKAQLVEQWMATGMLTPEEAREMIAGGVGAVVGLRDDPFKLELRRQISRWEEGPPEGWQPFDPMGEVMQHSMPLATEMGMAPDQAQRTIEAQVQQGLIQLPVDPMMEEVWKPRAHHQLPNVAVARMLELSRLMATRRFHEQPRPWQGLVEQEFQRMVMMSAPPMPPPPGGGPPPEGGAGGAPPPPPPPPGERPMDNPALTGGQPGSLEQVAMGAPA